jgi:RNA polymerase sigma-70 factor (ECF subfamily)
MALSDSSERELLERIRGNDPSAATLLLNKHRQRLKKMVAIRMDHRLTARLDPSDVVQEALTDAAKRMSEYPRNSEISSYLWVRSIAIDRLTALHRRHLHAKKRSVNREEFPNVELSDQTVAHLANRLSAHGTSPSGNLVQQEEKAALRDAMSKLTPQEREVLELKYLEDMSTAEVAAVQDITERTVRRRHREALMSMGRLLRNSGWEKT